MTLFKLALVTQNAIPDFEEIEKWSQAKENHLKSHY